MEITLSIMLWLYAAAYSIHIVEESTVGEGFVRMMQRYWSEYDGKKFFGFNTLLYSIFITGLILYEVLGGAMVIFPLSFAWMFVTNGLWHLIGTILSKRYSPGLITSPIYWILMYFIIRYFLLESKIVLNNFLISLVIGTIMTCLMIGSIFYVKKYYKGEI
ncbi:MAG: HXXEE domain-containing protein [Promethearchaeota archaeon]